MDGAWRLGPVLAHGLVRAACHYTPVVAPDQPIIIIGGGGHALVVAEAAADAGWRLAGCLDDDERATLCAGEPCAARLGRLRDFDLLRDHAWIVGIGDVKARRTLIDALDARPGAATITHPAAHVSPTSTLERGIYVGPGAIVHTRAVVADHAILNTGCVVEHECRIGANAHIAPGAVLGGRVTVGTDTLIGLGSRILPNLTVGAGCVVGAGAVVTRNVPDGATVVGHPARSR